MEISMKSFTIFAAVIISGLSAGFFYAWSVSVIPGTRKISDLAYLQTMQSINRAILNPAFFLIFFGSLLLLVFSGIQLFKTGLTFWLISAALLTYLVGTFGVTAFGNVPLNNQLDVLNIHDLSAVKLSVFRQNYEVKWNRLHTIRTVFAVVSFLFSLLAVFSYSKSL